MEYDRFGRRRDINRCLRRFPRGPPLGRMRPLWSLFRFVVLADPPDKSENLFRRRSDIAVDCRGVVQPE